jgi:hypothetical protein
VPVSEQVFRPLFVYWGVAGVGGLMLALFGWQLWQTPTVATALFLCITLGIVVWGVDAALSRVTLSAGALWLSSPLCGQRCVEPRQLTSVVEAGRLLPVLALVYHPQLEQGLLDLDALGTLILPAVQRQADLLATLQARMPP